MNGLTLISTKNSKDTLRQMKMRTKHTKSKGQSKSSPAKEIHSITGLSQEIRKITNKQSNFTLKASCKRTPKQRLN